MLEPQPWSPRAPHRARRVPGVLARLLRRRRRWVAALLLAAAAGLSVEALRPAPPHPGDDVVALAADLPAGHVVREADLLAVPVPAGAVPDGALTTPAAAVGHRLAGPARAGELLTDARLAGPGLLVGAPPGSVAVGVPLPAASAGLVAPGDAVLVLAAPADALAAAGSPAAAVLADRAVVLQVPAGGDGGAGLGALGAGGDGVVVLALARQEAVAVAAAVTGGAGVSVALLP